MNTVYLYLITHGYVEGSIFSEKVIMKKVANS
jgi:hypothetical protein